MNVGSYNIWGLEVGGEPATDTEKKWQWNRRKTGRVRHLRNQEKKVFQLAGSDHMF